MSSGKRKDAELLAHASGLLGRRQLLHFLGGNQSLPRFIHNFNFQRLTETMDPPTGALDFYMKSWGNIFMNLGSRFLVLAGCQHRGYCRSERRLDGKTVVITGANTGIGYTTADFLWKRGADVVLVCRDRGRGEAAMKDLKGSLEPGMKAGRLKLFILDLASFASIRKGAQQIMEELERIDILINNAGIMTPPFTLTEDGFESQFGVNHLGHFLLTLLLLPKILESTPARIINVSSIAHKFFSGLQMEDLNDPEKYYGVFSYSRSKAANVIFTRELAKRLRGKGVNVYALNPGYVASELYRYSNTFFPCFHFIMMNIMVCYVKDWWEGSQTTIHCAICESTDEETGLYYDECRVAKMNDLCKDEELCSWLWEKSLEWTGLESGLDPTAKYSSRPSPLGQEDIAPVSP